MTQTHKPTPAVPHSPVDPFVSTLLEAISEGKRVINVVKDHVVFSQGDAADAVYFIESGRMKISIVSSSGKEAVLGLLGLHGFFGEGALIGQLHRMNSATAVETATLFQVEKRAMLRGLRAHPDLSEKFTAVLLSRNMDLQEDLGDQLLNDSEKRLARVLLKIYSMDKKNLPTDPKIAPLSHETLAEMVGTTRSHVTRFMNKFRDLGLIEYKGHLTVNATRLTEVILKDDAGRDE